MVPPVDEPLFYWSKGFLSAVSVDFYRCLSPQFFRFFLPLRASRRNFFQEILIISAQSLQVFFLPRILTGFRRRKLCSPAARSVFSWIQDLAGFSPCPTYLSFSWSFFEGTPSRQAPFPSLVHLPFPDRTVVAPLSSPFLAPLRRIEKTTSCAFPKSLQGCALSLVSIFPLAALFPQG